MPFVLRLVIFGVVFTSIIAGFHYLLWKRLVAAPGLSPGWKRGLTWLLVVLGVTQPATMILGRSLSPTAISSLAWVAYIWMGFYFFLLMGLAATGLPMLLLSLGLRVRRLLARRRGQPEQLVDPSRRLFLARARAGAVAAAAGVLGSAALRQGTGPALVKHVRVLLPRLPPRLEGMTILQLTDIHVGPTIGKRFIEDIVRRTNAEKPDLVAITGDLVDGSVEELREAVVRLGELSARHGVYFVTGNHEYYAGVDPWLEELKRMGIRVLRNERLTIGPADASLDLAGIDDHSGGQYGRGHGADLPRALAGRDPSRELVLLSHQPRVIAEASQAGAGLVLSGHTHGGQMWPWGHAVRLQQPYVRGLHRHGDTHLYVSCGTGYWGPPMRLGAPAEITRIELHRPPRNV
jgi:predicted MPP superfamily phosphohydrolase